MHTVHATNMRYLQVGRPDHLCRFLRYVCHMLYPRFRSANIADSRAVSLGSQNVYYRKVEAHIITAADCENSTSKERYNKF